MDRGRSGAYRIVVRRIGSGGKAPRGFADFASRVARAAGRPLTSAVSIALILARAVSGPVSVHSDAWQLVIDTGTTIATFLTVFPIQNTRNRDGAAIQVKLDERIRASAACNRHIGIDGLTEEELADLRARCASRAASRVDRRSRGPRR